MLTARGFFGGGDAEYVQDRVDGVPVGDANSGIVDWRALSARDIDHIEAVRGAASPMYGDTALAGVIQVFTRTASAEGSGGSASISGGSFGTARAEAEGGASAGDVRFDAAGSGSRTDGYREHAAEKNGDFLVRARRESEAGMWAARAYAPRASGVASNLPIPSRVMSAAAVAMSPTPVILSVLRDW